MTDLLIRELSTELLDSLTRRAAQNGTTVEVEARSILERAMLARTLADLAYELFGPEHGVELDLPPRGPIRSPPDFS